MKIPTLAQVSCALDIRATPILGARVTLKLIAPCHPNVVVTIKHGGLQFKERLDANGVIELKILVSVVRFRPRAQFKTTITMT
ncbi:MAG: hypothetical protein QNK92_07105 [Amylibacter sp.]